MVKDINAPDVIVGLCIRDIGPFSGGLEYSRSMHADYFVFDDEEATAGGGEGIPVRG